MKARQGFTLSLLAALIAIAQTARAATLTGASIRDAHGMIELRFAVRGRGPQWRLSGQHQQLTIELAGTRLAIPPRPLDGQELAPVRTVSVITSGAGDARIMIAVDGKVDYAATLAGNQLIVRFARTGTAPEIAAPVLIPAPRRRVAYATAEFPPSAVVVPPASASFAQTLTPVRPVAITVPAPAAITVPAPQRTRPLVVIDPGHGGYDPGTQSAAGMAEKDLALAIASRLQRVLGESGVNAELTRTDDRFLSLAERTQIANRDHAGLFVSIHLNSSPDTNTSGIESYYLDNTTDRATIRLARMENGGASGSSDHLEPNLNYVLTDLRQGDKANEAVTLAEMIEDESVVAADRATGVRLRALGARQGPFYVLVGAEMPSVLVECGFLSNPEEARRLEDPRYQEALAAGIGMAIVNYLNGDEAVGNL